MPPSRCFDPPHVPEILLCEDAADERLQTDLAALYARRERQELENGRRAAECIRFVKLVHSASRETSDENRA